MLKNLGDKNVEQVFINGTYKTVPNIGKFAILVSLLGFNKNKNNFVQCCYIFLTDETQNIYEKFLNLLKNNLILTINIFLYSFSKPEENAILEIFKNIDTKIVFCFIHLIKCWWKKLNVLGLGNKRYIKTSKALVFNLKVLALINIENIETFNNDIKN